MSGVQGGGGRIQSGPPGSLPPLMHQSSMGINQMQSGPMSHGAMPTQMPQNQMNSRFQNTGPHQPNNAFPPNANHQQSQGQVAMHPQNQGGLTMSTMSNDIPPQQEQFSSNVQGNVDSKVNAVIVLAIRILKLIFGFVLFLLFRTCYTMESTGTTIVSNAASV